MKNIPQVRALHNQPYSSVTGCSSKPVTIAPSASNGGLLFRWGSFCPQELARFKELLEKSVRLKHGWPDNKDMFVGVARFPKEEVDGKERCSRSHGEGFEGGNNDRDDVFEHKTRGARGRASLVLNSRGKRSVKCNTQLQGCLEAKRVCGDKVYMRCGQFLVKDRKLLSCQRHRG
ncbi:hypothetical protein J1N35_022483 [Gossypium stocksii]|uniref:Uncharacterized protein n=1 Tax=Gossypium stocksii TaxID=47602 RepID=A0A9D3VI27_9ROSI|nr:hypothetical protein J1N35_022483 [Gossypium stocksii]